MNRQTLFLDYLDEDKYSPLTEKMLEQAQKRLGYELPSTFVHTLLLQNGGYLRRWYYPTQQQTPFGDYFACQLFMGIGGTDGIDSLKNGTTLSEWLIREWNYPPVGIVFSHFGHSAYLLDYKNSINTTPRIIYAFAEYNSKVNIFHVANNFSDFLEGLQEPPLGLLPKS